METQASPARQSWILQLAALVLWTIVTCYAAYRIGFGDGQASRGTIVGPAIQTNDHLAGPNTQATPPAKR